MKALSKKLLPLTVLAIAVTSLFSVQPAQAYTVTLEEMMGNVVATGSGAFNLTGLTSLGSGSAGPFMQASAGALITGLGVVNTDLYSGFTGPASFGSGGSFPANSGSGAIVGVGGAIGRFVLPHGYGTNTSLSSSATWDNATFASLGVTPGTYVWNWGTGANQSFTLQIGAVPDGGSTVSLLGLASLGLVALRRKLSC